MAKKKIKKQNKTSTILTASIIYSLVFLLILVFLLKPKTTSTLSTNLTPLGVEWALILILATIFLFTYYKKEKKKCLKIILSY